MMYQTCDAMMSIGTEESAFLNISFEPQLIKLPNFCAIGRTGAYPSQSNNLPQLLKNQLC